MSLTQRTEMRRTPMPSRKTPLRPVSRKRARQNRERAAVIAAKYPERPPCECGRRCGLLADDVHEPKFRSRLGSITDPENMVALSRECHEWIHAHPEKSAKAGLAVHSWA